MTHILLAGSNTLAPLVEFIDRELAISPAWWIGKLDAKDAEALNYADTKEVLASLVPDIANGQLASIQMRREQPPPLLVGLYQPNFIGASLALWTCVFEGEQQEVADLYDKLRHVEGIEFAALSVDELPDLGVESVSVDTFPWDWWQLIRARIREPGGHWTERSGPAA